ncbi:glutamate/gamma-aminobutyrate family transporter YjeM [Clostridium tarantellae]|uniref:Glutamate/gamma-aminobutyrate family transporter YjeM n=1 Tax=Clostridium tarantellae TaxID=39493 RepID=A0A6I1MW81_9CLOT|nr:glutamate/gamma-aminobutyrate family transporter YjeM [Clostridium tarantellae]MPQ44429.1 glutamate/gamma-aminobutyrate family transporter YjeM [Clostridium tarantellae]
MTNKSKKLTLFSLVLMIFTSVYGFANMHKAFFLMGYAAIPWYILGAVAFFIPYAFMMAEYGAAFKNEKGGIFSWMELSVGAKYAFIGTFMWYVSYVIWQVNVSSSIWVPLSNAIFGEDRTPVLNFLGLSNTQALAILGCLWIILVTYVSTKGLDKIKKITSVGGTAVALLNLVLIFGGLLVLILNHGKFSQPITNVVTAFTKSPNPNYQSFISTLSFFTFAIFAYGGIEVIGGLVDQTENPTVTFPKGVTISAIIISIGYSIGIFIMGAFINWQEVLSSPGINNANVAYIIMQNLGYILATSLGASNTVALEVGLWLARFVGLSMFLALTGAFFTLTYSPLKQLIEGTPKGLWPEKFTKLDKNGMPVFAMCVQAVLVIALILLFSFAGKNASEFFDKLIIMTNVAMTIPYMFLSAAFPFFKKKDSIKKPFKVYKSYKSAVFASIVVTFTVGFANVFSILEPGLTKGKWGDTALSAASPVIFAIIAIALYKRYEISKKKQSFTDAA